VIDIDPILLQEISARVVEGKTLPADPLFLLDAVQDLLEALAECDGRHARDQEAILSVREERQAAVLKGATLTLESQELRRKLARAEEALGAIGVAVAAAAKSVTDIGWAHEVWRTG
jgi:hypothetical protein